MHWLSILLVLIKMLHDFFEDKKMKKKLAFLFSILLEILFIPVFAKETPVENLHEFALDNGLTLFVAENHAVPLAYIEIAFRTGSVSQTPENAGLFHLYEHMLFKGNALHPDAASVKDAMSRLGVASWNGTTSPERVNYFFTIPSDRLDEGLAFWNAAVRSPLLDPDELEREKKVVISEIMNDDNDPGSFLNGYSRIKMFPEAPYAVDVAAYEIPLQNATVSELKKIKDKYYIPANAALFVGGDVDPEKTFALVKKIFGSWSNNGNSVSPLKRQFSKNPIGDVKYCVLPYDKIPENISSFEVSFRGPDALFDVDDTYPADYLCNLFAEPDSLIRTEMSENKGLEIPGKEYFGAGYQTSGCFGGFYFSAKTLNGSKNICEKAENFYKQILDSVMHTVNDGKSFSVEQKNKIMWNETDSRIRVNETAAGILSNISFWWTSTSADYFYSYIDKLGSVSKSDCEKFIDAYFMTKKPLVLVLVNPKVYEKNKKDFEKKGFELISKENSVWWNMDEFKYDASKITSSSAYVPEGNIYKPEEKHDQNAKSVELEGIEVSQLKNGIPLYVKKTSNKVLSVSIGCRGGIQNLSRKTSGLEKCLFDMLAKSSEKYGFEERKKIGFDTTIDMYSFSKNAGSALVLQCLKKDLEKGLDILADGYVHPAYEKQPYDIMFRGFKEQLQNEENTPESLLYRKACDEIYKGHPLEVDSGIIRDSVKNLTIKNMKKLYEKVVCPENTFVVACGDVDPAMLLESLNKTLGEMKNEPSKKKNDKAVPRAKFSHKEPRIYTHPSISGSAHVARVFEAPNLTDDDYVSEVLATEIFTDVMFNVVREKYGICYSPSSYVRGSRSSFGIEFLYRVSDFNNFFSAVEEARDILKAGNVVKSVNDDRTYNLSPLSERLENYKNKYINATYEGSSTSFGQIFMLTYNLLEYDDINHDKKQLDDVRNCTSEKIIESFKKYSCSENDVWYAVTGPENKKDLKFGK